MTAPLPVIHTWKSPGLRLGVNTHWCPVHHPSDYWWPKLSVSFLSFQADAVHVQCNITTMSSSHSLLGLPHLFVPSMNRIDVISLPSSIKHKWLKKSVLKMRSVYLEFKRYGWVQKFIEMIAWLRPHVGGVTGGGSKYITSHNCNCCPEKSI